MKILVTVDKFNDASKKILEEYASTSHAVIYNNTNKKLTEQELSDQIKLIDPDIIIAGTEKYNLKILNNCNKLKIISRVGIGVDSIDMEECKSRGIIVKNTPDAPTNAVAELTVGQMFNSIRKVQNMDSLIRENKWIRYVGRDLSECSVGIIGYGRIGSLVHKKIKNLCSKVYVYDIDNTKIQYVDEKVSDLKTILINCDIITLHIPLNEHNKNIITKKELDLLKKDSIIINTSRGGIINEEDLYDWLSLNEEASSVIDVFDNEPYEGKLIQLKNCYLTPHLGSCTIKSRYDMEIGAIENIKEFL